MRTLERLDSRRGARRVERDWQTISQPSAARGPPHLVPGNRAANAADTRTRETSRTLLGIIYADSSGEDFKLFTLSDPARSLTYKRPPYVQTLEVVAAASAKGCFGASLSGARTK